MKDELNNKTEILTMNGVEVMSDIASFILSNTFKTPRLRIKNDGQQHEVRRDQMSIIHERNEDSVVHETIRESEIDNTNASPKQQEYESHQEITVTAAEAETLLLSMQATHKLLEEDTQSFIDIRLEQRIEIFTQMTQILNLSFKLYDVIPDRDLKQHQSAQRKVNVQNSGSQSFIKRPMLEEPHN